MTDEQKLIAALRKRLAAKDSLLAAYRTGGIPSAKTFKILEDTKWVEE